MLTKAKYLCLSRIYVLLRSRPRSPEACGAVPVVLYLWCCACDCLHCTLSIKRQPLPALANRFRESGTLKCIFCYAECLPGLALQESSRYGKIADDVIQSMLLILPIPPQDRPSHRPHVSLIKVSGCGSMIHTPAVGWFFLRTKKGHSCMGRYECGTPNAGQQ